MPGDSLQIRIGDESGSPGVVWTTYAPLAEAVRPGDQLVLRVELVKRRRNLWRFAAVAEVDGKVVAETQILMADGPKS